MSSTLVLGLLFGFAAGSAAPSLLRRGGNRLNQSLIPATIIAASLVLLPGIGATLRQLAALALVAVVMALVRMRQDLYNLRIEARAALRLVAGSLLWQVGIALRPSGRTAVDFVVTIALFTIVVTAFDLRREPDETDLVNGLSAALAFVLLSSTSGQLLVSPAAAVVAGIFTGLLVIRRHGPVGATGIGPFLGTMLAALAMLTGDAIATQGVWRTEVVISTGALILGPAAVSAIIVLLDRLRNGFSPLAEREDHLIDFFASTAKGRRKYLLLLLQVNVIHGTAAIALGRTSGSMVFPILATIAILNFMIIGFVLRASSLVRTTATDCDESVSATPSPSPELHLTDQRVELGLLRPGTWIRRSRLVWAHRDADVPDHLYRTRIRPQPDAGDRAKGLWLTLLSWTIRRRTVVPPRPVGASAESVDILVGAKNGRRILYIDSRAKVVIHRYDSTPILPEEIGIHARTFEHLRGSRIARITGNAITQELLGGHHLHDVEDAVRIGALASLLLDVIALTAHTSQDASEMFLASTQETQPELVPILGSYRTVVAPATQSLNNVILTGAQEIAWIETLPLAECSFHLPWFGIATRLATMSPAVEVALRSGAFDTGIGVLLNLGGVQAASGCSNWEFCKRLPWTRVLMRDV